MHVHPFAGALLLGSVQVAPLAGCGLGSRGGGGEMEGADLPFGNYSSMCPYLVGSHEEVGTTLGRYLELGSRTFPLDVPREATDLANARLPFAEAMKGAPS